MGGSYKWPSLDECADYRRQVKELILAVIERTELELPIVIDTPWVRVFRFDSLQS